jgi:hypothetical protein
MQMILRCDSVWDNANLLKPSADKLPTDWDQRESKAIGLAVEDSQLVHLLMSTSACEM